MRPLSDSSIPAETMSAGQAALRLGLSVSRVRQLCDEGALTFTPTALGRLIDTVSVERLAEQRAGRV